MYIYGLMTKQDGLVYIGQCEILENRYNEHRYCINRKRSKDKELYSYLKNKIFNIVILSICHTQTELDIKERFWIKLFIDDNIKLFNISSGGKGNNGGTTKYDKSLGNNPKAKKISIMNTNENKIYNFNSYKEANNHIDKNINYNTFRRYLKNNNLLGWKVF